MFKLKNIQSIFFNWKVIHHSHLDMLPFLHQTRNYASNTYIGENYYSILGISPNSTPAQIKMAYYNQAKVMHPDMQNPHQMKKAPFSFSQLNSAYEVLSDPTQRKEYDQQIKIQSKESIPKQTHWYHQTDPFPNSVKQKQTHWSHHKKRSNPSDIFSDFENLENFENFDKFDDFFMNFNDDDDLNYSSFVEDDFIYYSVSGEYNAKPEKWKSFKWQKEINNAFNTPFGKNRKTRKKNRKKKQRRKETYSPHKYRFTYSSQKPRYKAKKKKKKKYQQNTQRKNHQPPRKVNDNGYARKVKSRHRRAKGKKKKNTIRIKLHLILLYISCPYLILYPLMGFANTPTPVR